ncbi:hypothetical protein FAM09_01215 [Niastella caeni]|uniref:Uncharacterized protein n=1 Tax=Niastella caeni TaxID=2569763 RepID=A0A4S8HYB7_9BACT|nr:hypothetical protein [Niastella caeni]THU40763.1 hypothetical protein FAM09_01215 [Niastella caeni]
MTASRTYKQYVAAILLALYAFIVTPVQLWHCHNATTTQSTGNSSDKKLDTVSATVGFNTDSNCPICTYKFSTCNDDAVVPVVSPLPVTIVKNGYYYLPVILIRSFSLSNKGPPSIS